MQEFILLAPDDRKVLHAVGSRRHATQAQAEAEVHEIIASHRHIVVAQIVSHWRANITAREYDPTGDTVKLLPRR
jgi:hypothetical protein